MLSNPQAKRILCYGDSNTWGQLPGTKGRFAVNERWTGVAQAELGDAFDIIEEGLGGRTTDLEHPRKAGRNGKTYFLPCLSSHNPLAAVAIMLGTNDYKIDFGPRPAEQVAAALKDLAGDVAQYGWDNPKVILINPIRINTTAPLFAHLYSEYYNDRSAQVAAETGGLLQELAQKNGYFYIDAAAIAQPGDDGIHINKKGHKVLGELFAARVKGWLR